MNCTSFLIDFMFVVAPRKEQDCATFEKACSKTTMSACAKRGSSFRSNVTLMAIVGTDKREGSWRKMTKKKSEGFFFGMGLLDVGA